MAVLTPLAGLETIFGVATPSLAAVAAETWGPTRRVQVDRMVTPAMALMAVAADRQQSPIAVPVEVVAAAPVALVALEDRVL